MKLECPEPRRNEIRMISCCILYKADSFTWKLCYKSDNLRWKHLLIVLLKWREMSLCGLCCAKTHMAGASRIQDKVLDTLRMPISYPSGGKIRGAMRFCYFDRSDSLSRPIGISLTLSERGPNFRHDFNNLINIYVLTGYVYFQPDKYSSPEFCMFLDTLMLC